MTQMIEDHNSVTTRQFNAHLESNKKPGVYWKRCIQ